MNKFSELPELDYDQIQFVDSRMYPWGSWINEGRLDKPELNILYKLMKSVEPRDEPSPVICSDELGMAISEDIEMFFNLEIVPVLESNHNALYYRHKWRCLTAL